MNFRIGFPVDAGSRELSFIVATRVVLANSHFCTGGQGSGLRENSGAAYVFCRALPEMQQKCRYEFTLTPMPNNKVRPDNLCDVGYSDCGACALAVEQYYSQSQTNSPTTPLLLISCAFVAQPQQCALKNIMLEKVTGNDLEEARKSLLNKWHAACSNNAQVLILHSDDAKILSEALSIKSLSLKEANLEETSIVPLLISCETHQWPLLLAKLKKRDFPWPKYLTMVAVFVLVVVGILCWHGTENSVQKSIMEMAKTVTMADIYKEGKGECRQNVRRYVLKSKVRLEDYKTTLLKNLHHKDWQVRIVSVYLIGEMSEKKFAEAQLLQFLVEDSFVGFVATTVVSKLQPSLNDVLPLLDKLNNQNERFILEVMKNTTFVPDTTTCLSLEKYLDHSNRRVVGVVLHLLKRFAVLPSTMIPILIEKLSSRGMDIRNMSAQNLMLSQNSVPFIVAELKSAQRERKALLEILNNKPHAEMDVKTIQYLLDSFSSDKLQLKHVKKDILLKVPLTTLMPILLQKFHVTDSRYVREGIMFLFSYIEDVPSLPQLIPTVLTLLSRRDLDFATYRVLLCCIKQVGAQARTQALPKLWELLTRRDEAKYARVRREVLGCLARMGRLAPSQLDYVWFLLQETYFYRWQIIDVWLANSSPQLVASMVKRLPNLPNHEQAVVIYTLGEMRKGKNALQSVMHDTSSSYIKVLAIEALGKTSGLSQDYVKILLKIAATDQSTITQSVCMAIFQQFHVKESIAVLRTLQQHRNSNVRAKAHIAIAAITSDIKPLLEGLRDLSPTVRDIVAHELAVKGEKALAFLDDILQRLDKPQYILPTLLKNANYSLADVRSLLNYNESVKIVAIQALEKFSEKSLPLLREILREKKLSTNVLRAIVAVLRNIRTSQSCELLNTIIDGDVALDVEVQARRALREIKS